MPFIVYFVKVITSLLGDDRNIQRVFVAGRDVTPTTSSAIKPVVPVFVLCMIQLVLAVFY